MGNETRFEKHTPILLSHYKAGISVKWKWEFAIKALKERITWIKSRNDRILFVCLRKAVIRLWRVSVIENILIDSMKHRFRNSLTPLYCLSRRGVSNLNVSNEKRYELKIQMSKQTLILNLVNQINFEVRFIL